jgi:hypothetical protein
MKIKQTISFLLLLIFFSTSVTVGQTTEVDENSVRGHMEFLASDEMQGRGSGTEYERLAGVYFGAMMRRYGILPAGHADSKGRATYLQTIDITRSFFSAAPTLTFSNQAETKTMTHGKEIAVIRISEGSFSLPLQKIRAGTQVEKGVAALVRWGSGDDPRTANQRAQALIAAGASAVLVEETPQWRAQWNAIASRRIGFTEVKDLVGEKINIIALSTEQIAVIESMADGTIVTFGGELAQAERSQTWNAVGKIEGSDSTLSSEVILLSAHMDHVGVRPNTPGEDKIFNGADDDASGCIAVLELAKILARPESRPKRTVYFVFFGSEEAGGFGSRYFVGTIPFPKERLVANLQFEMLGRPDPKVNSGELWLTGYERSDLGITLASKGARLVADPHPEQNFFQRSDNYNLARLGIVAHTVSSFGLHKDYHQPTDEIDTIDFGHMTGAIESLIDAVRWLVNSDFKPSWYEGKRP